MAFDLDDSDAMFQLGDYYHTIEKRYDFDEKYYLMVTDKGDSDAMFILGGYYHITENYDLMKNILSNGF